MDCLWFKREKSRQISLYVGCFSLFSVCFLLFYTEILVDASVKLNRVLLYMLVSAFVPFFCLILKKSRYAVLISVTSFLLTVSLCFLLFYMRNRVTKVFVVSMTDEDKEWLKGLFDLPRVLIIAGEDLRDIPEEIVEYANISEESKRKLKRRLGVEDGDEIEFTKKKLSKTRFSGIAERMLIVLENGPINKKNYRSAGFTALHPQ